MDTGKYCFGVEDTLKALDLGAVETLIVWENLETARLIVKTAAGEEETIHLTKEQQEDRNNLLDKETRAEMEVVDKMPLLEWFAERYNDFGAKLEFITNKSSEGSQFVKGFGGIGGLLRYKVDFGAMVYDSDEFFSD